MAMFNNIVQFPGNTQKKKSNSPDQYCSSSGRPYGVRGEKNMHTLLFRSRDSILQSDEPDLVRDVCFDIDRAQGKLERIRARLESLQEYAATEIQLLTDADTKLSAASSLLCSRPRGRDEAPAPIDQEAQPPAARGTCETA